ncbi:2-dehydropantoate 2-reductase [Malassezia brasiliensis]|uniref:2-dehydropantoate 2-reductase n=1 Tax=Malassezia brasiliensis TaxID=1821822 RepID=A0AAF0DU85_9BASI|nr:2-dehydropantoate 2-reductase [Malassezia brasiliensis]
MKTHSFGDYTFRPDAVYASVDEACDQPWDYVVVATKALNLTTDAAAFIAPVVSERTTIVLIQNGLDVEAPYRARFPGAPIVSAITISSIELTQPSEVVQYRWTRISLGPYTDRYGHTDDDAQRRLCERGTESSNKLAEIWQRGGIRDTETYDALGIQLVRWHKLCINASMNVSGVLSGCLGNDAMTQDPLLRTHLEACMHEVLDATPKIYGVSLPDKFATPEAIIRSTERNKNSRSSMVQDWTAHRPIELEAILGNGLRVAQEHGVVMPRLATMYALLQSAFRVHMAAT